MTLCLAATNIYVWSCSRMLKSLVFMPNTPTVLVVDDSTDGREMLAEYLTFRGFQVRTAAHGAEAIEIAHRIRPAVVLIDLSMAGTDGWEATRQLKGDQLTTDIVVLALTAHAFPAEHESARAAGCDAI